MSETASAARDVEAVMKYVVRGEMAKFHAGDRAKSYWPVEEHLVTIRDMRPRAGELSFDRNGFVLLDRPSAVGDFAAEGAIEAYCRETEDLVRQLTGAAKTISFGPILRTSAAGTHGHNQPAYGAHVDYGERTVRDFTFDLLPRDEAERRLAGRTMLINVWRPLALVESAPFALCDASTVKQDDLFESEVIGGLGSFNRRSLWGWNLAWAPGQQWYWAPRMQPRELLAFKLWDSDPGAVQLTAHSAFDLPDAPPGAAPRQSIELRTISFLD